MKLSIKLVLILVAMLFFSFFNLYAQTFEGKILSKNISINVMALDELMYGNEEFDEEAYDENYEEEEYSIDGPQIPKIIMDKYFALPIDEMKQAVEKYISEYGDDYMEDPLYEETNLEVLIKGTKMRTDTHEEGMKMSIIMDMGDPVIKMIRWDDKLVINMDLEKMKQQMETAFEQYGNLEENIENDNKSSLEPTGEKKEINGMMCELYKGTDANNTYQHIWMAKSIDEGLLNSFKKMSEMFATLNPEEAGENDFDFYIEQNSIPV
ncbi:MAG: hypothetical protein R3250_00965, partial [Melioribacteraceae bacterium]|nr:hypothetical protein [Melioribacteraceae bacterium]